MKLITLFLALFSTGFAQNLEQVFAKRFDLELDEVHLITDKMKALDNYSLISAQIISYLEQLKIGPSTIQEDFLDPSHHILLENDQVRVLEIINKPFEKEQFHTHKYHSINISFNELPFTYYNGVDGSQGPYHTHLDVEFYEPEPLHAVENIGNHDYASLRIEIKK